MSLHFQKVTIKNIQKETADCVSIELDIPEVLADSYSYKAGQHITVRAFINGEEVRRSYSLCSAPLQNLWKVAVKKVNKGLFSTYANEQLKAGDALEIMPPMGHFFIETNKAAANNYVAIAAGSGITPVISLIKTVLSEETGSSFTLIYGNKNLHSIIFKEELEALKNRYMNRFTLIHVLSREKTDATINSGRITPDKLQQIHKLVNYKAVDAFFICGPEELIFSSKQFLESIGVDEAKIRFELFNASGKKQRSAVTESNNPVDDSGPKSNITIKLDGRAFDFELPFSSEISILDAALKQGADLPFACKGGVCCTCKAKLLEGEIVMDVCYGLEHEEVEQGFILTCQSHPKTEKVIIDFDIK